jgi:hypothetical protein
MKLGRNLARTFLDYYKLQNYIVFNPAAAIMPKLNTSNSYYKNSNPLLKSDNTALTSNNINNGSQNLGSGGGKNANSKQRSTSNLSMHTPILKPLNNLSANALSSNNNHNHSNSSMSNASGNSNEQSGPSSSNNTNKQPTFFLDD